MTFIELSKNPIKKTITVEKVQDIMVIGENGGELELTVQLVKEGATANVYGILVGQQDSTYEVRTISHHQRPNTNSRVHIKGILMDKSQLDYEGMIRIEKEAQLSDAYLQNDNMLVGNDAVANSSPQLEILADDVKASHGVTISTLDELSEYYIQSRGIPKEQADKVLMEGFVQDILQKADVKTSKVSLLQ